MRYVYMFETRGIQRFLFASGRLRDMLGGSELVDYLCADGGLLDQTLRRLELTPDVVRKAGGAFYLLFITREEAERLRAAWRLACAHWLPGVEKVDVLASGKSAREAIANGLELLREERNRMRADLPRPGPLAERSARTGFAAVKRERDEAMDAATARQRSFNRPADSLPLASRFLDGNGFIWPVNFEETAPARSRFPLGERRLVGLLHADGNGLGELLRTLNHACERAEDKSYIRLYRKFSDGLGRATLRAAQTASREVLVPAAENGVLPARPLVLGGDDLTIVLRADLALGFARVFLAAFEAETREAMDGLRQIFVDEGLAEHARALPAHLTACAGLCYMKCSQPFHAGHELAESLCKRAKGASRKVRQAGDPMPATLALHKVQDSLLEDAESQFRQNHVARHEVAADATARAPELHLALPAYALHPTAGLPALDDLLALTTVFDRSTSAGALNDRPLRELATMMHANLPLARHAYVRWRDLATREHKAALGRFDAALGALVGETAPDLPCSRPEPDTALTHSPISDLLSLLTVRPSTSTEAERLAR
ncbi:hypothetical protein PA01_00075 [Azoarcus sp. PA01]|nr:hypothetical protein PA01_19310 [Azoarcus sp. PA01]KON82495.1 hypothetical protein PA01_00075 [Azoarcus sp. PA01]